MSEYLSGNHRKDELVPRIDPSLNRAVDFAVGEGLVSIDGGKTLLLTPQGQSVAVEIINDGECMAIEVAFLVQVARQATETKIEDLLTWKQVV